MEERTAGIESARVHLLFLCLVRYVVESCGGTMEVDPETYKACITVPEGVRVRCLEQLDRLPSREELHFRAAAI